MTIITYYLEMLEPPVYVEGELPEDLSVIECERPQPELNKFLYSYVGRDWDWTDRLTWTQSQWDDHVQRPELRTWVAYVEGAIAGYFELDRVGDDVELLYFGLTPDFIGQGLGRPLLEDAVRKAWGWTGAKRVWVHTCNLDHPSALQNYERRGFALYKTTETNSG